MSANTKLAILGAGNIGRAIALGLVAAKKYEADEIILTRRNIESLKDLAEDGFQILDDNERAVGGADIILVAVAPQQLDALLTEIAGCLEPTRHRLISVVSGVSIAQIRQEVDSKLPVVRAMPNTAIAVGASMTCLAATESDQDALQEAEDLFEAVGEVEHIPEAHMVPATAICACGTAFFLRIIRAAMQGGIQIGFHPDEARRMAAQTALGAAKLILSTGRHPEHELDRVTTPEGCTIKGLIEMEDRGVSAAMIRGIIVSAKEAELLYAK